MLKKIAIVVIVLALLGAAGLGVWASTPLDEILSPTPEATATPVPTYWTDPPLTIVAVSGSEKCSYRPDVHIKNFGVALDGWTVNWGFTPGPDKTAPGTLRRFGADPAVLVDAAIAAGFGGSEPVTAGTRYEIEAPNGGWSITIRPPKGIPYQEFSSDTSVPNTNARYCRAS